MKQEPKRVVAPLLGDVTENSGIYPSAADVFIAGLSYDYLEPSVLDAHEHDEGQLVYAASGVIVVGSDEGYWIVPPTRALWLPAGARHWARTSANVSVRSVFVKHVSEFQVPERSCVLSVSPLMKEVINALAERPAGAVVSRRDTALTNLLMLELEALPILPLHLPAIHEPRLLRIERHVFEQPDKHISLEEWARVLNVDKRTLHRLFVKETGMPYRRWLQQVQLLLALEWLAAGRRIVEVSEHLGYSAQSAFTVMFKRNLGMPPGAFLPASLSSSK